MNRKKRRKEYLSQAGPFVVPASTRLYRENSERRLNIGGEDTVSAVDVNVPDIELSGHVTGEATSSASSGRRRETEDISLGSGEEGSVDVSLPVEEESSVDVSLDLGEAGNVEFTSLDLIQDDSEHEIQPREVSSTVSSEETSEGSVVAEDIDEEISDYSLLNQTEALSELFREFGNETLPNSTTLKSEALVMVMAYIVSHNLSWTAADDLLKLINALLGFSDAIPRSKYLLRKLWSSRTKKLAKHFYYCSACAAPIDVNSDSVMVQCPVCGANASPEQLRKDGSFFSILDIQRQMTFLLDTKGSKVYDEIKKHSQHGNGTAVRDIRDGQLYKQLVDSGELKDGDLTLTVNTDGSPLFKSSKMSVWPIQFVLNELPPKERFLNVMLGGLWFGRTHPNMALFLDKFVTEVCDMGPVSWNNNSEMIKSKVVVTCFSVDAPARAAIQNHNLYTGYFSCTRCLIRGERVGGATRFPYSAAAETKRTHEMVVRDMEWATKYGVQVNGVKGPSALLNLPLFDMVRGQSIDYMHCLLLGVTKQLTDLMLSSSSSGKDFYIGDPATLSVLDKRLMAIRPPHIFTRLPRHIYDRADWKASEWRHWLLFYFLPCTLGLLPPSYWKHMRRLSEASAILLSTELSHSLLDHADELLQQFVARAEQLYGITAMTFNMHQLLHLTDAARDLGPLWAHSAFAFETGNGSIVKLVKAANGVPSQILERVALQQELDTLLFSLPLSSRTEDLCNMWSGQKKLNNHSYFGNACFLGTPKVVSSFKTEEANALSSVCGTCPASALEYFRFVLHGTVLNSNAYRRLEKSSSSVCLTKSNEYVRIERIFTLRVHDCNQTVLLCKEVVTEEPAITFPKHMKKCFVSPLLTLRPVFPDQIAQVSLFVNFGREGDSYVFDLPNLIERD